jgi:hypothetical protein
MCDLSDLVRSEHPGRACQRECFVAEGVAQGGPSLPGRVNAALLLSAHVPFALNRSDISFTPVGLSVW